MRSSFGGEVMSCSNIADVPEIVKKWLDCLWTQPIPRTWRQHKVASISIEELRKGQMLNSTEFVIVTHGYLSWKEIRLGKNFREYLMCTLTPTSRGQGVLFFIFQKEVIDIINEAPLHSMIGLCGLQTVPRKPHCDRAYSASGRTPGAAAVLELPKPETPTPSKKRGRPLGAKNRPPPDLTPLSFWQWREEALKESNRTRRTAGTLSKRLLGHDHLKNLNFQQKPSRRNIQALWKSVDPQPAQAHCNQSKVNVTPGGKRKKVGSSSQDNKEENQDKEISGGDSATEALDVLDERNESVVDTCFAGTEDPGNLSACTCSRKFSRCFENFQDVLKT
jgi:hypothetical protein